MEFYTDRLYLRPWKESDAVSLYKYAKDSSVGPAAGWPAHTSVENSREIIKNVLSQEETYAICLKQEIDAPIGSIGLMLGKNSHLHLPNKEAEIGYWIGVPFWGHGLMPEACKEIIRHGFEDLLLTCLWCGYFEGNEKSKRVQEKCGFVYDRTEQYVPCSMIDEKRTEHITCLKRLNSDF